MDTLDEVLIEASKDKRVCPQPTHWKKLWETLPNRKRQGGGWEPPLPLILGAWWETSNSEKRERFHDHIRWADQHGVLNDVAEFILSIGPEDWYREE